MTKNSEIKRSNILIIGDKEDVKHLDINKQSDHWNIFWEIIDYDKLPNSVDKIRAKIKEHNIDFILYTRNDQVANRMKIGPITNKLKIGYSSISGIDEKFRIEEMKNCFDDFIRCNNKLYFDIPPTKGTFPETSDKCGFFSLMFDTEQMGCVRYGLPRILALLNKYDVKATFFITNLMKKVYSNVVEEIVNQGHDIGIHGEWHEYLSNLSREVQSNSIKNMVNDFNIKIQGANFIGRMNNDTVAALIDNKLKYFVYPSYPRLQTSPSLAKLENGDILMIPISVETYNSPWFSIRNMINTANKKSLKYNKHITILCHPFRDGNLQHIEVTEKLLKYLVVEKEMKSITIEDISTNHDKHIKVNDFNNMNLTYKKILTNFIPQTKEDFVYTIPQNILTLYRLIRKGQGHSVW